MNLRCSFCQTPFTIGRIEKLDALQYLDANNLTHYDAHCPRCRKATPVLRQRLEMSMPNWREELKELEKEMSANPQQEAPLPQPVAESASQTETTMEAAPAKHHRVRAGARAREAAKAAAEQAAAKTKTKKAPAKKKTA